METSLCLLFACLLSNCLLMDNIQLRVWFYEKSCFLMQRLNMVYQLLCDCRALMACTVNSSFLSFLILSWGRKLQGFSYLVMHWLFPEFQLEWVKQVHQNSHIDILDNKAKQKYFCVKMRQLYQRIWAQSLSLNHWLELAKWQLFAIRSKTA